MAEAEPRVAPAVPSAGPELGREARSVLLRLARLTVRSHVRRSRLPPPPREPKELRECRGVFVTLRRAGELRGCIGHPTPHLALGEAVIECAVAAASNDPRFLPVTRDEEPELELEISVLSLPVAGCPGEIVIGRHGLIVTAGGRRGLLLPQVAVEHGFTAEELLAHTCIKAGLGSRFDPQAARLELFTAEVFRTTESSIR